MPLDIVKPARVQDRTRNVAAAVALIAYVMAIAIGAGLAVSQGDSNHVSDGWVLLFFAFGACCVAFLGSSLVLYSDLSRRTSVSALRRQWIMFWLLLAPVALPLYWWRHVRRPQGAPPEEVRPPPLGDRLWIAALAVYLVLLLVDAVV
jgi:MFS family permease